MKAKNLFKLSLAGTVLQKKPSGLYKIKISNLLNARFCKIGQRGKVHKGVINGLIGSMRNVLWTDSSLKIKLIFRS